MPPGTPSANLPQVTEGLLLTLVIGTDATLPGRRYPINFATAASPWGAPEFSLTSGPAPTFVNGSFGLPEPTCILLLAGGTCVVCSRRWKMSS